MKFNSLLLGALVVTLITACSSRPEDKFIGKWESVNDGKLLMVPVKCGVSLEITKNTESNSYTLNNLNVVLNPAVFGLKGGQLFNNVPLVIKDEKDLLTPKSASGDQITITLKNNDEVILVPNPCNGISPGASLKRVFVNK